ncbi:MAG: UDP-N-acetylmuramate--L-alanine ligase [Coriobacteriales bacterium]|jgi:UDP-N-acetylmuramate--alanine ligase|nr:UDP-N-acetylmuramate--L-alanine ligase [Coriobacteriales bacterium]
MIGVLGGMGPEASLLFYRMVIEHTKAQRDQDHVDLMLLNHASMPDRTTELKAGRSNELFERLMQDAHTLEVAGAEALVVTCNTSHVFAERIAAELRIPFINMVEEAAHEARKRYPAGATVGVLATDGTIASGIYHTALEKQGLQPYSLSTKAQAQVMSLIYDGVKAGGSLDPVALESIEHELSEQGCVGAVLACTELSVLKDRRLFGAFYLDALLVLARRTIEFAGAKWIDAKPDEPSRVHFIGVGGSGMSGIALIAAQRGLKVSGSDLKESSYLQALLREGLDIRLGHDAKNVTDEDIDVVIVSTAVPADNPEYLAAHEQGLTIWHRARMLSHLGKGLRTLAVAGTHGKTTTSSMLATTLARLGVDPTFLIGGVVDGYDSTAHTGTSSLYVVEADESDGSFVWLNPHVAVITNVEADHLDHYQSIDDVKSAFTSFLAKLDPKGFAVICADSPGLSTLAEKSGHRILSYGLSEDAQVRCEPHGSWEFDVIFPDGERVPVRLGAAPGHHNMLNATAVLTVLDALGFDRQEVAVALSSFTGVRRRFDRIGAVHGVAVIDDYGHHPTEVAATLTAASELEYKRVHVLFQPHRYTRTQAFAEDFGSAFDRADTITLMEVYPAGEDPIEGVNSTLLLESIKAHNPAADVQIISDALDVPAAMAACAKEGDLIITMGAGDVTSLAPRILEAL